MLRSKDLNAEIKTLEDRIKEGVISSCDVVKALCLLVKVTRDIRSNQVMIMKAQGVALLEPEVRKETEEK